MKRLTVILMSLVMAAGSATALADRGWDKGKGHGDRYDSRHNGKHFKGHYDKHYDKHYNKHYKGGHHHVYYYPRHDYRPRGYYSYDPYLPLGAALVGGAIGYTLGHSHDNASTTYSQTTTTQVSGCYRIERYQDGSERRVELPPSACY
ncbi:hypothetical protein [Haliea sp. E17]|uniref:hypothetical protein n=1 Tax=Haliea sp. E17 TaxID=3401576 RepID=UPI003AB0991E